MDKLDKIRTANSCVKGGGRTYLYLIRQLEELFPNLKQFFQCTITTLPNGFVKRTFTTTIKGLKEGEAITFSVSRGENGPEISYTCSLHGSRILKVSKTDHPCLFGEVNVFLDQLVLCENEKITQTT